VVFSGDTVLNALQLVDPRLTYLFDEDAEAARSARLSLLDQVRSRDGWLATSHLTDPFVRAGGVPNADPVPEAGS
jgi:hypothetical protein